MNFETIDLNLRGDVATIAINNPAMRNALGLQTFGELNEALDEIEGSARAVVLTGVGSNFCSGASLDQGGQIPSDADGPDFGAILELHVNPLVDRLRGLPVPWITAVRGPAAGFGCALALAGDLVVASQTAYFYQSFGHIGLVPDGGSTHLLTRGTSRVRAMEMMLLGEKIPAATALEWGLVNRVVADDALDETAADLADRLAAGPTVALGHARRIAWSALDSDWNGALAAERDAQRQAGRTLDAMEGIGAFLTKRPAQFQGR